MRNFAPAEPPRPEKRKEMSSQFLNCLRCNPDTALHNFNPICAESVLNNWFFEIYKKPWLIVAQKFHENATDENSVIIAFYQYLLK